MSACPSVCSLHTSNNSGDPLVFNCGNVVGTCAEWRSEALCSQATRSDSVPTTASDLFLLSDFTRGNILIFQITAVRFRELVNCEAKHYSYINDDVVQELRNELIG